MSAVLDSHPEYRALIRKVIDDPSDDTFRVELANWLDNHHDRERADFIRTQLSLHRLASCPHNRKGVGSPGTCCQRCDLETHLFNLLVDHGRRFAVNGNPELSLKIQNDLSGVSVGQVASYFERGFVHRVELKWDTFLAQIEDLFNNHPITHVTLKDRHPIAIPGGGGMAKLVSDAADESDSRRAPIPARIFARLQAGVEISEYARQYESEKAALEDLSNACVRFGHDVCSGLS